MESKLRLLKWYMITARTPFVKKKKLNLVCLPKSYRQWHLLRSCLSGHLWYPPSTTLIVWQSVKSLWCTYRFPLMFEWHVILWCLHIAPLKMYDFKLHPTMEDDKALRYHNIIILKVLLNTSYRCNWTFSNSTGEKWKF